jgi:hypothetical protein
MTNTKAELLQEMKRLGACSEATDWVTAEEGNADEIWTRCTDVSWLIWFAGMKNPTAISAFAARCAERAKGYAAASAANAAGAAANPAWDANYAAEAAEAAAKAEAWAAANYAAWAAARADDERALQLAELHQMLPSTGGART